MAIPLPTNQPQAAGRPSTPLEVAVDQVAEASRDLLQLAGQLADKLSPVLVPEPPAVTVKVSEECRVGTIGSPLVQELHSRAAFLRSVSGDLRGLLDRLEV